MSDLDERLERKLRQLEGGASPDALRAEFKGNSTDIADLVYLARAIREMPHPQPSGESKTASREKVLAAARARNHQSRKRKGAWFQGFRLNWALAPALAGMALVFLCLVVVAAGAGIWLLGPPGAQAATLTDAVGRIEVADPSVLDGWKLVSNGHRIGAGQRIRSGENSSVTLVFFDGSRITMQPNTDLTLAQVKGGWGKALNVAIQQNAGDTVHVVNPLRGRDSSYVVFTPSGSATVHGTAFEVLVEESGESLFKVDTGRVQVNSDGRSATLEPGQGLYARPTGLLSEPSYLFVIQGELTAIEGDTWVAAGVTFTVTEDTLLIGSPEIGDLIMVEGRILEDSQWVADIVQPALTGDQAGAFTGIVESITDSRWTVGGITLLIDANTVIEDGIEPGMAVRVAFQILDDGTWLASRIDSLESDGDEPPPPPLPDEDGRPKLSFEPKRQVIQACSADLNYAVGGSLENSARRPEDAASSVLLGFELTHGEEYFDLVLLNPDGWEIIQPGEQVNFEVQILMKDTWLSAPQNARATLRVFIAQEGNDPRPGRARYTITLGKRCDEQPTATPTVTLTPSLTPAASETPTPTATGTVTITPPESITPTVTLTPLPTSTPIVDFCVGAIPHPKGMNLAQKYGVSYEEIMGWFCKRFGFGEIDLAYGLSVQYGVPVEEVFGLRESGMGWGQIMQWYAEQDEPPAPPSGGEEDGPGKGKDKDKPGGGPPPGVPPGP
jgi:hypothetical protein